MLETKFILRANICQRSVEKLVICMNFHFFKEKLIESLIQFDLKLTKQKVEKFLFLWKFISSCNNKGNATAGQFTTAAENLPLRKRKLDSNFSKKPTI